MRNKRNRRDDLLALALAGIGSALSLAFIAMSVYLPIGKISFSTLAGAGVMLPLAKDFLRGGALSYIASSLLSLLFGPLKVLQFVTLFGLYPLLLYVVHFKLKIKLKNMAVFYSISYILKLIYFNLIAWLLSVVTDIIDIGNVTILGSTVAIPLVIVIANLMFILYDIALINIFKVIKYYAGRK